MDSKCGVKNIIMTPPKQLDSLLLDPPPHTCEGRAEYCKACWVDEIERLVEEIRENENETVSSNF